LRRASACAQHHPLRPRSPSSYQQTYWLRSLSNAWMSFRDLNYLDVNKVQCRILQMPFNACRFSKGWLHTKRHIFLNHISARRLYVGDQYIAGRCIQLFRLFHLMKDLLLNYMPRRRFTQYLEIRKSLYPGWGHQVLQCKLAF